MRESKMTPSPQNNFWKGFQELMAQLQPDAQQRPGTAPINAGTNTFAQAPANNYGSFLANMQPQKYQMGDFAGMNQWGKQQGNHLNTQLPPISRLGQRYMP